MKIALCQFDQVWEDREANKAKIKALVASTPKPFDWIVFPEMTLSGFSMSLDKTTLTKDDSAFFSALARDRNAWVSFGGVQNGRNDLITLDRAGKLVDTYSKIHLYSFGEENKFYKAGTKVSKFDLEGLRVVPTICFDLRFPYLFWDAAEQADVFINIASWPARRSEHYTTLVRARAIENQCYALGVDRTGKDPLLEYSGNSMLFDPLGKVLLDCGTQDGVFVSDIDVTRDLVTKTRTRFPFFRDKKAPGAYECLKKN
ncbi:MAG TPA: nitrilase-related carbon-nitrogen hydrolase [Elusimicrobiota bacterium]|nr:nitrilase-related carbon-nitrogen hydrolase [Elusimicrobiota bacterium]